MTDLSEASVLNLKRYADRRSIALPGWETMHNHKELLSLGLVDLSLEAFGEKSQLSGRLITVTSAGRAYLALLKSAEQQPLWDWMP